MTPDTRPPDSSAAKCRHAGVVDRPGSPIVGSIGKYSASSRTTNHTGLTSIASSAPTVASRIVGAFSRKPQRAPPVIGAMSYWVTGILSLLIGFLETLTIVEQHLVLTSALRITGVAP